MLPKNLQNNHSLLMPKTATTVYHRVCRSLLHISHHCMHLYLCIHTLYTVHTLVIVHTCASLLLTHITVHSLNLIHTYHVIVEDPWTWNCRCFMLQQTPRALLPSKLCQFEEDFFDTSETCFFLANFRHITVQNTVYLQPHFLSIDSPKPSICRPQLAASSIVKI